MENQPVRELFQGKHICLLQSGRWEYAERTNASGAAVIVAITNDSKLVLTEQFRIPVNRSVIELPAGLSGDNPDSQSEPFVEAARRELLEETGYEAEEFVHLWTGPTSAGLTSEMIAIFHAKGLRRISAGGGIEQENIVLHEVPLTELHQWLEQKTREGLLVDPKVFAGLYLIAHGH